MRDRRFVSVFAVFIAAAPQLASAETYLCIASGGAVLEEKTESGAFSGSELDVSSDKYIYSNTSGKWQAKLFDQDFYMWDDCGEHGVVCRRSGGRDAGKFAFRSSNNTFFATYLWGTDEKLQHIMVGGDCTAI